MRHRLLHCSHGPVAKLVHLFRALSRNLERSGGRGLGCALHQTTGAGALLLEALVNQSHCRDYTLTLFGCDATLVKLDYG
jgi:hypothetical protein